MNDLFDDLWCARTDHETPTPATGFVIASFPTPVDIRTVLQMSVPVCARHSSEDLPPGIYEGEVRLAVLPHGKRGRSDG